MGDLSFLKLLNSILFWVNYLSLFHWNITKDNYNLNFPTNTTTDNNSKYHQLSHSFSKSYLLRGISEFFSTQLRKIRMLQLVACCNTDSIGPTFWAPRDTGSTTTTISRAGSATLCAGNLMTLQTNIATN